MLLIIPEIRIVDGVCQETIDGQGREDGYYIDMKSEPTSLIRLLRRENAKSIAVNLCNQTDLAFVKDKISELCNCTDIPIQVLIKGNVSIDAIDTLEDSNISRLVVDIRDEESANNELVSLFEKYNNTYPLLSIRQLNSSTFDFIVKNKNRIYLSTNYSKEWKLEDINTIPNGDFRITLYNGISSFKTLKLISNSRFQNIDSCLIGKPLFDNSFPCQKIWRNIEKDIDSKAKETEISNVRIL